jgi:hypothetical protein
MVGKTNDAGPFNPDDGTQPKRTAKTTISIVPSQNPGTA